MIQKITLEIQNDTGLEFEEQGELRKVMDKEYYYNPHYQKICQWTLCEHGKSLGFHIVLTPKVDHELESARKKFPVGSWFYYNGQEKTLFKVHEVRNSFGNIVVRSFANSYTARHCTPFPLPTWRCCESDKPKKDGKYLTRRKNTHEEKEVDVYCFRLGWNCSQVRISDYEWLDEGKK